MRQGCVLGHFQVSLQVSNALQSFWEGLPTKGDDMARSYAETTTLHCPHCGQPFEAEIWLTVDTNERPDLVKRIQEGTLHAVTCPHCGHQAGVPAPLLVHDAEGQRLLFAPPQGTSQEQDRQMAGQLAGRLAQNFLYPRPAYLGQIQAVPLELLGLALEAEDPAALQTALEERMQAALAEDPVLAAVQALIAAESPAEVMAAAREYPILLSGQGQALIRQGIENARQMGQEDMARHIEERYEVLRQLHQLGATPEQLAAVTQMADIPPEIEDILAELGPVSNLEEVEEKLRQRPDLREKLKALQRAAAPQPRNTISYAAPWPHTCPACGQTWEPEVWQIVDAAERPDLVARIHEGILHAVTCPACGETSTADTPLMYHDQEEGQLLLAIPEGWSGERGQQENRRLFPLLRAGLDIEGELPPYLERTRQLHGGLPLLSRTLRGEVDESVTLPPELRRAVEALGPELGQQLLEIIVRASSPEEFEAELEKHPQLREALAGAGAGPGLGDVPPDVAPILQELARPAGRADMPRRIELCQQALRRVNREENPALWAALQNTLANSLVQTPRGDRADNIEQAIHHYAQALEVYTRQAFPSDWAMTQNNLATAYSDRIRGDRADNIEQAIHHYAQALEVYTLEAWPERSRGVYSGRGHAYFAQADWAAAHADYDAAIRQAEEARLASLLEEVSERISADISRAYANDTYALAWLGQQRQAWERGESGRTRALREALARREMEQALTRLPPQIQQSYRQTWEEEQALRRRMELPKGSPGYLDYPEARPLLEAAVTRRREAEARVQTELPEVVPAGLQWEDFQAQVTLPEGSVLAELMVTEHGTLALLAAPDDEEPRPLFIETFTASDLEALVADLPDEVREWIGAFNRRGEDPTGWLAAMVSIVKREGQIEAGWYFLYRLAGALRPYRNAASLSAVLAWRSAIGRTIEVVGQKLWPELSRALAEVSANRVILVPQGQMFLLPLHAAAPEGLTVAYAPSASVWARLQIPETGETPSPPRCGEGSGEESALIAANPTGDLPYTPSEAQAIADLFDDWAQILWREQVTEEALLAGAAEADILHYSGHGQYNWDNPEASGLRLRLPTQDDDGVLSLAEIREQLKLGETRLVSLSACETGLTSIEPGQADEYVGLPAGFLLAGAPAVVASLWSVDDLSTALLMERFYRLHLAGDPDDPDPQPLPIAQALAQAQKWLRELDKEEAMAQVRRLQEMWRGRRGQDYHRALGQHWQLEGARYWIESREEDRPFGHPFHWAAFQAVGAVL
jgi:CHAT domain-containing protein